MGEVVCIGCGSIFTPKYTSRPRAYCSKSCAANKREARRYVPLKDRLLRQRTIDVNGCWLWSGHIRPNGYGSITIKDRACSVHTAAYKEFIGPIPDGMCVCHTCDIRHCFNPEHLWIGTRGDNNRDAFAKGRNNIPRKDGRFVKRCSEDGERGKDYGIEGWMLDDGG